MMIRQIVLLEPLRALANLLGDCLGFLRNIWYTLFLRTCARAERGRPERYLSFVDPVSLNRLTVRYTSDRPILSFFSLSSLIISLGSKPLS